jgi:hypothetical protein
MYLTDREIKALSADLKINGPNGAHPFEPGRQIQPCSIDLRVSDVLLKPRRRRWIARRVMPWRTAVVDLGEPNVHALNDFRDWKKVRIRARPKAHDPTGADRDDADLRALPNARRVRQKDRGPIELCAAGADRPLHG